VLIIIGEINIRLFRFLLLFTPNTERTHSMTEESSLHLSSAAEMERKIHPKEDYDNEEDEGEPYPPLSPSSCSSLKLNMDGSTTTTTLSRSTSAVVRRDTTEEPSDANILSGDDSSQSSKGPITMDSKIGAEKVGMLMKKTKLFTACDGNNVEQPIVGMVSSSNSDNTSSDRKSSVISLGGSSSTSKRTRRTTGTLYGIEEGQPQQNQQQQRHHQKQRRHRSSMELRRMPENVLLKPANLDTTSVLSDDPDGWKKGGRGHDENDSIDNRDADFWRKTCLRPTFTLRTQMMLSFGTINVVTITLVVAICVALSVYAGDNVKTDTEEMVTVLTTTSHRLRSRYLSELLSEQLFLVEPVKLLYEATRDRFEGYPNPSDDSVPFVDLETGRNKYPIVGKPMPLEWDVNPTITGESLDEFLANRRKIFENRTVDVFNAAFMVQGVCDPKETDPTVPSYWPGCTDANNNITTGGVIAPTSIAESIYRKGSDLVPLMRSIFEGRDEIMDLGLYFANDGAGAYINYPQYGLDIYSYSSTGCDWLLSTHPYDPTRTIGSQEMISNCHPEGELVPIREYNPLERSWCRDQALNPEKVHVHCYENVLDSGNWIVSVGNAVYDRTTNEFVACTYVGIHMSQVDDILTNTRLSNNTEASLVLWGEDGFIVSSSKWSKGVSAYDTGIGLTKDTYDELYNLVDYDSVWDPKEARDAYDRFSSVNKEYCASAHPMPPIPEQYDPLYRPVLFVISSHYSPDLDEAVDDVSENVDARVYNINKFALICGLAGIATATIVIFVMARMLTAPLTQMNKVANEIVNNFGDSNKEAEIQKFDGAVSTNSWFTPKTELSEVVAEFNKMVAGFSGASEARSEKYKDSDMENHFPARRELWKIYSSRSDRLFKYNPTGELVSDSHEIKRGHEQVAETATSQSIDSIEYLHHGPNHITALSLQDNNVVSERDASDPDSSKKCSPLFLWIVALIVTPLIFITLLVSVGVTQTINSELSQSTEDIQTDFVDLQMRKLLVYASLRSTYISSLTAKSTDDMQVLARFSTWLLFGGLNRSDSFTEVTTGIEECKTYSGDFSQCEYLINNFLCDCEWEEKSFTDVCTNYNTSVRHSETIFWFAEKSQSSDGDRLSTDFPNTSASPETTEWWKNVTAVPGWRKGRNASGYDTTYDRIRVMSANPLFQPLFHYGLGSNGVRLNLGGYVAFEADGLVMGYGGCSSAFHVDSVIWNSTEENNAANMRPELCPLGKYGYDPRYVTH
jgi:HAMP domain-containing protein